MTTASEIFDFLEEHQLGTIDKQEITSSHFAVLRRSVRKLLLLLNDSEDDVQELWERLRALLSEWLTVPLPFKEMREELIATMGSLEAVTSRWGSDIGSIYKQALVASGDFADQESPMRERLREIIVQLRAQQRDFKIFCHSRARVQFESLVVAGGQPPLEAAVFLHSVRQYREVHPFDTLIKAGPLRVGGWGSAPDALMTAPRFNHLAQVIWWGCGDEQGFGYDPVSPPSREPDRVQDAHVPKVPSGLLALTWKTRYSRYGDELPPDITDLDELQTFRDMEQEGLRPATLVQIGSNVGVLYPPHSQVLSLDPDPSALEAIQYRVLADSLVSGMYLIHPLVNDVDLGAVRAQYDSYSRTWKERLARALAADEFELALRLRKDGLNLEGLRAALRYWCRPPSTVIHAPKQRQHFLILMRAIGLGEDTDGSGTSVPFWRRAWNEIRRSRGQAIQAGVQEHEIVDEQLKVILKRLMPEIRSKSVDSESFSISIPDAGDIQGSFDFSRVLEVEMGFRAPDAALRTPLPLDTIEQWRV